VRYSLVAEFLESGFHKFGYRRMGMRCDSALFKRRKFLKEGILFGALCFCVWQRPKLPLNKKIVSYSEGDSDGAGDCVQDIARRYGGEFGNIKPQTGRQCHVRV
jgi:hypothetical protein